MKWQSLAGQNNGAEFAVPLAASVVKSKLMVTSRYFNFRCVGALELVGMFDMLKFVCGEDVVGKGCCGKRCCGEAGGCCGEKMLWGGCCGEKMLW